MLLVLDSTVLISVFFFFAEFLCQKYILYGPFAAKVLHSWIYEDTNIKNLWCLHILVICALRGSVHQAWSSYSNMLFLTRNRRIQQQGVDFKQIDREWDW